MPSPNTESESIDSLSNFKQSKLNFPKQTQMSEPQPTQIHATGEATGFIPAPGDKGKPITVIGTNSIRAGFDASCLQQALNARSAPGVTDLVLNPDAHSGYGAPVGCVLTSQTHIYPGPVGVDIKCSMSFLQLDLPADQVADKTVRRALIDAIVERTPTGPGPFRPGSCRARFGRRCRVQRQDHNPREGPVRRARGRGRKVEFPGSAGCGHATVHR